MFNKTSKPIENIENCKINQMILKKIDRMQQMQQHLNKKNNK